MNKRPELIRLREGVHKVTMLWRPKDVKFCFNGLTAPIHEVKVTYKVENRYILFPFEISSYKHEGHDTSAWVVRATGTVDGEDAEIRFTCVPKADGSFSMTYPQLYGIKEGVFFFWGYEPKSKAT